MWWDDLLGPWTWSNAAQSAVLLTVILVLRTSLIRGILRVAPPSEARRRWVVSIRNFSVLIIVLGLAAIWFEALAAFGAVLLAVGVAFVIATKEMIMCVTGSFIRTINNTYSVGDRIEIGAFRGDVIDLNLFTTTLLEVGPGRSMHLRTGRTVVVPNSKLLDQFVVNESFMKQFVVHVFSVPVKLDGDWREAEKLLLQAAEDECGSFIEEARDYMDQLEVRHGLHGLPVQPRCTLQMTDPDKGNLLIRVPAPVGRQGQIEQAILRRYLTGRAGDGKAAEHDEG
jgi:small-conductance mechanosensitive channel